MLLRLKNAPMNVPEQMLPLLDMVIVLERHYTQGKGIMRCIKQVAEVGRMDEKVLLSNVYEVDEKTRLTVKTRVPSSLVEKLATAAGITKNELSREMRIRQKILEFMLEQGIRKRSEVEAMIQHYYFDPEPLLKKVASSIE
jgi:flagellar protein FlaI